MASEQAYLAAEVALWFQRACGDPMQFLGCYNLTGVTVPRGETNPSYCRVGKNKFEIDRTFRGAPGLGSATITARDTVLEELQEILCAVNLYALHAAGGADENPWNYDYFYLYDGFEVTTEETDPHSLGLDPDSNARVMLGLPGSFRTRVKVKALTAQDVDVSALTTNDINGVAFCDDPSCDSYGNFSGIGCQVGYLVTDGPTAVVLKTTNGGGAWTSLSNPFTNVNDNLGHVACKDDVVIIANAVTPSYVYSWDAGDSFTEITTPTTAITRIFMLSSTKIWMAGYGGYIYYSDDRGASISEQTTGDVTAENLNDISAKNALTLYAVGDDNAFLRTTDGGTIWTAVTGPAAAIFPNDLYRVTAVPGTDIVFIGDEQGNVYRSEDNGDNWTTVLSDSTMIGGVYGIVAPNCEIVVVIGNDQDPYWYSGSGVDGVMFQSIDGGNSFNGVTLPANDGVLDLFACDVNRFWVSGVGGYLARVAGPSMSA